MSLTRFGQSAEKEPEPSPELTPMQQREKKKQGGHLSWVLKCLEDGNEDALKAR